MTAHPTRLDDRLAIEELLASYCELVDRADVPALVELFTEDATFDYGFGRSYTGRAELSTFFTHVIGRYSATSHHSSNVRVEFDGDRAAVRSYVLAWHRRPDETTATIWGRYLDNLVLCADGRWRFAVRRGRAGATEGFETPAGLPSSHELVPRARLRPGEPWPRAEHPIFDVMRTARATRRFTAEPVDEGLIEQLLVAATWAPSPKNTQPWEFVVVTGTEQRAAVAAALASRAPELLQLAERAQSETEQRMYSSVARLLEDLADVPVLIVVCGRPLSYRTATSSEMALGSALHAAAQNLLLAARALGLGAVYTTLHVHNEPAVRELLGIPDDVIISALIPVGWPATKPGPVRRRPVAEVVHHDHW